MFFRILGLHKITTYSYAHRTFHVDAIEDAGFIREGILREDTKKLMISGLMQSLRLVLNQNLKNHKIVFARTINILSFQSIVKNRTL